MANLTEHFTEKELGVEGLDERLKENAFFLCSQVLEPVREHFGAAIVIHDGYRNARHNEAVGGKLTSFHLFDGGRAAADFHVEGIPLTQVFDYIRQKTDPPLLFDKAILEHDINSVPKCVHVQTDRMNDPRRKAYIGMTGDAQSYLEVGVKQA